jgi:hypothetical protein
VRKRLIRTGAARKYDRSMDITIMWAEDLLNRYPSDATVREFLRKHANRIRELIPAKNSNDKRIITLNELIA